MQARPNPSFAGWRMTCAAAGVVIVGGCVSNDPAPEQMSRTAVQTAPADLQLLCANAAATAAGTTSENVLPVSSRQLDATSFEVQLEAGGKRSTCIVDSDGNVKSVQPA